MHLQDLKWFVIFPPSHVLLSDGNFADAVFRFNANISYSGVLHAVTQDVSVSCESANWCPCICWCTSFIDTHPRWTLPSGSFLREQGETHQQCHSSSSVPGGWVACSQCRAGEPFPGYSTVGGLKGRLPGFHTAAEVRLELFVFFFVFFTSMLLFLHGVPSGWAAGNRHALSFQGLVKGLEAQMQRKYISIHLSVPIRPLPLLSALSYLSVDLPSPLFFLKWPRSHPGRLDRHFRREVMSPSRAVRLDLSWPSPILPSHHFLCAPPSLLLSSLTIPPFANLTIPEPSESWRVTEMYERSCNYSFIICSYVKKSHSLFS